MEVWFCALGSRNLCRKALCANYEYRYSELTNGNIVCSRREPPVGNGVRKMPERCSRARVRFAAQNRRALALCAPFRPRRNATGGSGGNKQSGAKGGPPSPP